MDVSVKVERASVTSVRTPLLVVNLFEGMDDRPAQLPPWTKHSEGLISRLIGDGEIQGSLGEVTIVHNQGERSQSRRRARRRRRPGPARRSRSRSAARRLGDDCPQGTRPACRPVRHHRARRRRGGLDSRLAARTVIEASLLALYRFDAFKTPPEDPRPTIDEITVVERDEDRADVIDAAAAEASAVANAVDIARDLSQTPGNSMTPTVLADRAREMAESRGLSIQIWGKDELRERGMNAILAVNSGSAQDAPLRDDALRLREREREDAGRRRQGHHLRQRRHLAQAAPSTWRT